MVNPVSQLCEAEPVTIANGSSLSGGVNLGGRIITGVFMPAAWTPANLTFQASYDGVTYVDMYSIAGSEMQVTAAGGLYLPVDYTNFMGVNFVRVRSGVSAAPVAQAAARTINLMLGVASAR